MWKQFTLLFAVVLLGSLSGASAQTVLFNLTLLEDSPILIDLNTTTEAVGTPYAKILTIPQPTNATLYQVKDNGNRGDIIPEPPVTGTILTNGMKLYFSPASNKFGMPLERFTFRYGERPAIYEVVLNVISLNDAPVAVAESYDAYQDQQLTLQCSASDEDGDPISFLITNLPNAGNLYQYSTTAPGNRGTAITTVGDVVTDSQGRLIFMPGVGEVGRPYAVISYAAFDGLLDSDEDKDLTVNILVYEVPGIRDMIVNTYEDYETEIHLDASAGTDQSLISAILISIPAFGKIYQQNNDGSLGARIQTAPTTVTSTNRTVVYIPPSDQYGNNYASFEYYVFNGVFRSINDSYVEINVASLNDPPTQKDVIARSASNNEIMVTLQPSDVDGDSVNATIASLPVTGSIRRVSGELLSVGEVISAERDNFQIVYTPHPTDKYQESFTYSTWDGQIVSDDVGTVSVYVGSTNIRPECFDLEVSDVEDVAAGIEITLNGTDADSSAPAPTITWTFIITKLPDYGSLWQVQDLSQNTAVELISAINLPVTHSAGKVTYIPDADGFGTPYDTFEYVVEDSYGDQSVEAATVTINLSPVNDAPVPTSELIGMQEDTVSLIDLQATDVDDDVTTTTFYIEVLPTYGTLYEIRNNETILSSTALSMYTAHSNDHQMFIPITTTPHTVIRDDRSVLYVPPADAEGTYQASVDTFTADIYLYPYDSFEFSVADALNQSATNGEVEISVQPVKDIPIAYPFTINCTEDTPVTITFQGSEVDASDNGIWTAIIIAAPSMGELFEWDNNAAAAAQNPDGSWVQMFAPSRIDGTATNKDLRVVYQPFPDMFGTDTFTYQAQDTVTRQANPEYVSVTINIIGSNDPPVQISSSEVLESNEDEYLEIDFVTLVSDADPLDGLITIIHTLPADGTLYEYDILANNHTGAEITTVPHTVDASNMVVYLPDLHGNDYLADTTYYASFTYECIDIPDLIWDGCNMTVGGTCEGESGGIFTQYLSILEVDDPPYVNLYMNASGIEDQDIVIDFEYTEVDHKADVYNKEVKGYIETLPNYGHLWYFDAQMPGRRGITADSPGAGITIDTSGRLRLVYAPDPDVHDPDPWTPLDSMTIRVEDDGGSNSLVSGTLTVLISLQSVNDPPEVGYVADNEDTGSDDNKRTVDNGLQDLKLIGTDRDGDLVSFNITNPPSKGSFYVCADLCDDPINPTGCCLGEDTDRLDSFQASVQSDSLPSGYTLFEYGTLFQEKWIVYQPEGDGGGFPFTGFSFQATDGIESSYIGECAADDDGCYTGEASGVFEIGCDGGLSNNVWSSSGAVCEECPTGAACSTEGVYMPYATSGYWKSKHVDTGDLVFLQCTPSAACTGADEYGNNTCGTGYEDGSRLCGACEENYYSINGYCVVCPDSSHMWVIVLVALLLLLAILAGVYLFLKARDFPLQQTYTFISIVVSFVQTLHVLGQIELDWAEDVTQFFSIFSFSLFSIDLFALPCDFGSIDFTWEWFITMLMPIAVLVLALLLTGIFICSGCSPCNKMAAQTLTHTIDGRVIGPPLDGHTITANDRISAGTTLLVRYYLIFLSVVYMALTFNAFELLRCSPLEDGTVSFDADKSLRCDDDWWQQMKLYSILFTLLYAMGIPVLFGFLLYRKPRLEGENRYNNQMLMKLELWNKRYESLIVPFNRKYFWWIMVINARKVLLASTVVMFTNHPMYQGGIAHMLLVLSTVAQSIVSPYEDWTMNRLELVQLTCCTMTLFFGLIFYIDTDHEWAPYKTAVALLLIVVCATIIYIGFLLYGILKNPDGSEVQRRDSDTQGFAKLVSNHIFKAAAELPDEDAAAINIKETKNNNGGGGSSSKYSVDGGGTSPRSTNSNAPLISDVKKNGRDNSVVRVHRDPEEGKEMQKLGNSLKNGDKDKQVNLPGSPRIDKDDSEVLFKPSK